MYEYKVLKYQPSGFWGTTVDYVAIEKDINELGAAGWEIISMLTTNHAYGQTREVIITLKKQR